ncbi:MAG TPA: prephenate dehydrogenase/arogenate dehydrogenase family protein, partial [Ramlibacter sp.]|nr:prephenate dehydrogenase/arogenate dehydrogenase family protein [Ramlibacter sp.]
MFEQLGLIGCGLMGGSFALALKRAGLVKRVVGYSKSPSTTQRALSMGVIDVEAPSALLAVSGADIVLLAVPVAATEATFKAIRHLVTDTMLLMDVGSTKRDVIDAARRVLRDQVGSFVPCHPIAAQKTGADFLSLAGPGF